ncbi:lipid IV(A) palmitoyltransferase PagP [Thorsellia anophelis]
MGFWLPVQLDAAITKSAQSFFNQIGDHSDLIWRKPMYATLYVPAITWHNRYLYDKADTDRYNERPYGLGFGFEREDENSWQSLYAMAFKDSFSKIEPIAGYGYEKRFSLTQDHNWRVGVGYTLGVTARDNWYYAPIPVALPLASINYKQVSFQGTYIPGTYGNGNVFFAWLRFQIPTGQ